VKAMAGAAWRLIQRAPVGPPRHDFRGFFQSAMDPEQARRAEWCNVDADTGYSVLLQLTMAEGHLVNALFHTSCAAQSPQDNYVALYGTEGTLWLPVPGINFPERIQYKAVGTQMWEEIPVPQKVLAALPQVEDKAQRHWNQLALEFVADIRGDGYAGYPTFRDGWTANEIIDIVRSGRAGPLCRHIRAMTPIGVNRRHHCVMLFATWRSLWPFSAIDTGC
jgi:predicted dehydrogenase